MILDMMSLFIYYKEDQIQYIFLKRDKIFCQILGICFRMTYITWIGPFFDKTLRFQPCDILKCCLPPEYILEDIFCNSLICS